MSQRQTLAGPFVNHRTTPQAGNIAVMIASDPDPFQRCGHPGELLCRCLFQPLFAAVIVIIIAEAENGLRAGNADQVGKILQRRLTVIGRQHLAMAGEKTGFFQMQIRHQQGISCWPIECRRRNDVKAMMGEQKGNHGDAMR